MVNLITESGENFDWINAHPPQTFGCGDWSDEGWPCVIDSELFFFWIMKNVEEVDDLENGIIQALAIIENTDIPLNYNGIQKNCILTDGESVYAYKSEIESTPGAFDLYYSDSSGPLEEPFDSLQQHHKAVMSEPPLDGCASAMSWIPLENFQLIRLIREIEIFEYSIPFLGDLNNDQAVDILDILSLLSIILYGYEPAEYEFWAADLNSSGVLNISDIVLLVELILVSYF